MRRRTVYVATIVAMLAMVGGWALATTTTTNGPAQDTNITTSQPAGFSVATVTSSQTVTVSSTIAAYSTAGTQDAQTGGLAGTTVALSSCGGTGCQENFNTVNGVTVTAADYAEQLEISVTQPGSASSPTGFDVQIDILTNTGHVFGDAYFSTGAASTSGTQTVAVYLFVDLGVNSVTAPPTITSISVQFNSCLSATSCP